MHPLTLRSVSACSEIKQDSLRSRDPVFRFFAAHQVDEHVELGLVAPAELGAQRLVALGVVEHLLRDTAGADNLAYNRLPINSGTRMSANVDKMNKLA